MPNKRVVLEQKATGDVYNGIKLSASGRRLPFVLEKQILLFLCEVNDISALLNSSRDTRALVHDWLRTTERLRLRFDNATALEANVVLAAVRAYCLHLLDVELEDRRVDKPRALTTDWLVAVVSANAASLRKLSLPSQETVSRDVLEAVTRCTELRCLHLSQPMRYNILDDSENFSFAIGEQLMFFPITNFCNKLESLELDESVSDDAQLMTLSQRLPNLVHIGLRAQSIMVFAMLKQQQSLRSLHFFVNRLSSGNPIPDVQEQVMALLAALSGLEELRLRIIQRDDDVCGSTVLKLPALRRLVWFCPFAPPLDAPNLEEVNIGVVDRTRLLQWLTQAPALRFVAARLEEFSDKIPSFTQSETKDVLLTKDSPRWTRLERFSCELLIFSTPVAEVMRAYANTLREISIDLRDVTPADVQQLLASLPLLKTAHVSLVAKDDHTKYLEDDEDDEGDWSDEERPFCDSDNGVSISQNASTVKSSAAELEILQQWPAPRSCLPSPTHCLPDLERLSLSIADDALLTAFALPNLTSLCFTEDSETSTGVRVRQLERCLALTPRLERLSIAADQVELSAPCERQLLRLRRIRVWAALRLSDFRNLLQSAPNVQYFRTSQLEGLEALRLLATQMPRLRDVCIESHRAASVSADTIEALLRSLPSLTILTTPFIRDRERLTSSGLCSFVDSFRAPKDAPNRDLTTLRKLKGEVENRWQTDNRQSARHFGSSGW